MKTFLVQMRVEADYIVVAHDEEDAKSQAFKKFKANTADDLTKSNAGFCVEELNLNSLKQ